jgi:predicted nucleotide-binding protein
VGKARVYALIDEKVRSSHLPRHLAAIALAAERGVGISRYATSEQLAEIRQGAVSAVPKPVVAEALSVELARRAKPVRKNAPRRRGTTVFVVHGRDLAARDALFTFLRAVGLKPLEWTQALKLVRKGSPYVGEVLEAAFREAAAVVVLLTPDDEARLQRIFLKPNDPSYERRFTGQARPNVLFEAGMAFGKDPNSTVLVQIGELRPFSDIGGRHVVHLSDQPTSRQEFVTKLANAGCNVDTSGTDWLSAGQFSGQPPNKALQPSSRAPRKAKLRRRSRAARG